MTNSHAADEVEEFSLNLVTRILDDEGLNYRLEDAAETKVIRTGFNNAAISFMNTDGALTMEAMWRGAPEVAHAATLLAAINEWNLTQFQPTLRFFEIEEGSLAVTAVTQQLTEKGLSYNQTGTFVVSSFDTVARSFQWLEATFPELVTWGEEHDEH